MKALKSLAALIFTAASLMQAAAQTGYTTVTGSLAAFCYNNGSIQAAWQNGNPSAPVLPTLNGVPFAQYVPTGIDSDGNFTITLADTHIVQPNSPNFSSWKVTACAKGGSQPACYSATIPVTGATMNVSSYFAAATSACTSVHLPSATAAGEMITSVGPGTTYAIQPGIFYGQAGDTIASIEAECASACIYSITTPQTITLSGNHTLSPNVQLDFSAGGLLTVNGAFTLTIPGAVTGPPTQHFAGTATITGLTTVEPEWFGGRDPTAMSKALAACSTQGCNYQLQAATYQSPWTATPIGLSHVRLLGTAEGDYSGDNTQVIGGTIIQGTVEANADYFEAGNLCVDVGSTFIGGGSAQDGLVLDNPGQVVGAPQWQSPNIHDVCVLGSSSGAARHAMLIENTNNAKLTNLRTRFNADGLVLKGTRAVITGYVGSGHNTAALYIKGDTYAPTGFVSVSNIHVSGVVPGDTVGVAIDGGTQSFSSVTMNGITGDHLSIGFIVSGAATLVSDITIQGMVLDTMTQTGVKVSGAVQRLKIENSVINNPAGFGIAFQGGNVNYSTVADVQVTNAALDSFSVDGQYNKFIGDYSRNSGGYGFHMAGTMPSNAWVEGFSSFGDIAAPFHADAGATLLTSYFPSGITTEGNIAAAGYTAPVGAPFSVSGGSGSPIDFNVQNVARSLNLFQVYEDGHALLLGAMNSTTYTASASLYSGGAATVVSALATPTVLAGSGASSGVLRMRDNTLGGSAVFLIDPNGGAQLIGTSQITGITTSAAVTFSGGNWNVTLASGAVPRTINWTIYD